MIFSIIIPVYDDPDNLAGVLDHLSRQSFDLSDFEIIIVENSAISNYSAIINRFPQLNIVFIAQFEFLYSPYSCRNRGIEKSKGSTICFLDVTCWPSIEWLSSAFEYFHNNGDCNIMAGEVYFRSKSAIPTAAEIIDSCENIRMKESVLERQVAKTANLFVKREIFDILGMFPEGIRSGGDIQFTSSASKFGINIHFCASAYVRKEARKFHDLMLKQKRVGQAHPRAKRLSFLSVSTIISLIKLIIPPNPMGYKKKILEINMIGIKSLSNYKALQCYFCFYLSKIYLFKGQIIGFIKM